MLPAPPPDYLKFWLTAVLVLGATLVRWRHLDRRAVRLTAISLATLPLALSTARNVAVFLLVAVPAASALLSTKATPPVVHTLANATS